MLSSWCCLVVNIDGSKGFVRCWVVGSVQLYVQRLLWSWGRLPRHTFLLLFRRLSVRQLRPWHGK
jgi:hypothetical protein